MSVLPNDTEKPKTNNDHESCVAPVPGGPHSVADH